MIAIRHPELLLRLWRWLRRDLDTVPPFGDDPQRAVNR